jgi:hypothetical protein
MEIRENINGQLYERDCSSLVVSQFTVSCWGAVEPSSLSLWPLKGPMYQPRLMIDENECRTVSGMLGKRIQSIRETLSLVFLCPSQIPHDLTRPRTQTAAVGSRR